MRVSMVRSQAARHKLAPRHRTLMLMAALIAPPLVTSAPAATITNVDTTSHAIKIAGDDPDNKRTLGPGRQLEDICPDGCILRMNGSKDHDYIIEGHELLSVEGGTLYYDGVIQKPSKGKDAEK